MVPSRHLAPALTAAVLAAACAGGGPAAPERDEILWDTWGVPHVYGTTDEAVFRGQGWAQMASHGDLILRLYGQARGRAAEYWGERWLDADRWIRTMGVPERGAAWLEAQSPAFRRNLEAFADGMNAWAAGHPDAIDDEVERVLPVTAADVLAHLNRAIHFTFVTGQPVVRQAHAALDGRTALAPVPVAPEGRASEIGSNAWAIGPERSAGGNAMLVQNPHLPWGDLFLFWESHLVGPGTDVYGVTLVGVPGIAIGFNDALGWTHTVNTYDGADLYRVEREGDGYWFGDEVRPVETREEVVLVRRDDGSMGEETLVVRSTVHGPVVAEDAQALVALRVAGLDQGDAPEQWWDMGRATDLASFESSLRRIQVPMFNVVYADRDKRVFYLFNGRVPERSAGDVAFWGGVVDGSDPSTLWRDVLPYEALPRFSDPAVGWIQNANDPPWTTTIPPTLDADGYPAYLAPRFMHFRAQRSALMLLADSSVTFEEMIAYKHSTRMAAADRLLDDLIPAARASDDADAHRAADVLEAWDRTADADSRGGVLFMAWLEPFVRGGGWAVPWDAADPVATPDGLADPEAAAALLGRTAREVEARRGALDVRWGDVHRARVGEHEVEANGAPGDPGGVFRVAAYREDEDGRRWVNHGDTWYAALEFTPAGVNARVLLAYGNSSRPGSPHRGDQLALYARKEMRTPWRTRAEIEANLESTTDLSQQEE